MKTFWEYLHNEQIDAPITDNNSEGAKEKISSTEEPIQNNLQSIDQQNQQLNLPRYQPLRKNFKPKIKPWKAKKSEILTFWKALTPNIPMQMQPIEQSHKGSTLQQDTIRISGTKEFITTVLSRLKDFIVYENPDTKLVVDYRQNAKSLMPGQKNSYLFYVNVRKRK
jgi:hypothetical protein